MINKSCETCKHSFALNLPKWTDEMQKRLDEEDAHNKEHEKEIEKTRKEWFPSMPRNSYQTHWSLMFMEYQGYRNREEKNIQCRCMPTFVEHRKTDLCGQWSEKEIESIKPSIDDPALYMINNPHLQRAAADIFQKMIEENRNKDKTNES